MQVTTLGQALQHGWKIKAHCTLTGPNPKSLHGRRTNLCRTSAELDLKTLVWTRGELFRLDMLASRLKCPNCGDRNVRVEFEPPGASKAAAGTRA